MRISVLEFHIRQPEILKNNLATLATEWPRLHTHLAPAVAQLKKTLQGFELISDGDQFDLFEQDVHIDSTRSGFFPPLQKGNCPARVLVTCGFGMGGFLDQILKQPFAETHRYVVIEPSMPRFLAGLCLRDLRGYFNKEKFFFLVGLNSDDLNTEMFLELQRPMQVYQAKAYQFVTQPIIHALHPGSFLDAKIQWETALEHARVSQSYRGDALKGFTNSFENLHWIRSNPGIERLKQKFKGIPAIVAATGPSLSKSLDDLRRLQDRVLILAADASLKVLLDAGITPHFVFSLERDDDSKPFFENLNWPSAQRSHLIAYPLVPQVVLAAFQGPQWVTYRDYDYYGFFEAQLQRGFIHSGPSVAHMAAAAADYFGCREVALVGQDLAYDPERFSSHAAGVTYDGWSQQSSEAALQKLCKDRGEELFWVAGNLRDKVPTSTFYWIFIKAFVAQAQESSIPIWNATEGGAKIPEIPWRRLGDLEKIWDLKPSDLFRTLDQLREKSSDGPASWDWSVLEQAVQRLNNEIQSNLKLLRVMTMAPRGSSLEFSKSIVQRIRGDLERLYNDRIFRSLITHFSGARLVDLEWQSAVIFDDHPRKLELEFQFLLEWFDESESVLKDIQLVLTRAKLQELQVRNDPSATVR